MTKRILVIDDDALVQEIVQSSLEDVGGWNVVLASSGAEGIAISAETARSEAIDAILLDVSMPEMDGFETFQKLQDQAVSPPIPVIFLTAKVQPQDKSRLAQLASPELRGVRIAGTIAKPFDPMQLPAQIARLLNW